MNSCDFCESFEPAVAKIAGRPFCTDCYKDYLRQNKLEVVKPCPSCGNREPEKITIYSAKQLYCDVCKSVYWMRTINQN